MNWSENLTKRAAGEMATFRQVEKAGHLIERWKVYDTESKCAFIRDMFGFEIDDLAELTKAQAHQIIDGLIRDDGWKEIHGEF